MFINVYFERSLKKRPVQAMSYINPEVGIRKSASSASVWIDMIMRAASPVISRRRHVASLRADEFKLTETDVIPESRLYLACPRPEGNTVASEKLRGVRPDPFPPPSCSLLSCRILLSTKSQRYVEPTGKYLRYV